MTRAELLHILIGQARTNGFEFRRWYTSRLGLPWINTDAAITVLEAQRRYYALLFSHEFALAFWKPGETFTFQMPTSSFERVMPDGSTRTIQRKPFMRRTSRPDAWRYHLRQMALAEEPLRYMRRYLNVEDDLNEAQTSVEDEASTAAATLAPAGNSPQAQPAPASHVPRALALARSAAERRATKLDAKSLKTQKSK